MRIKATCTSKLTVKPTPPLESEDWNPVSNSSGQKVPVVASVSDAAEDRNDKERLVEEGGKEAFLSGGA